MSKGETVTFYARRDVVSILDDVTKLVPDGKKSEVVCDLIRDGLLYRNALIKREQLMQDAIDSINKLLEFQNV